MGWFTRALHNSKAHMDMEHTEESYITFSQRAFPNYLSNNDNGNINRSKQTKNQKIIKSNSKIKMPASTFAKKIACSIGNSIGVP